MGGAGRTFGRIARGRSVAAMLATVLFSATAGATVIGAGPAGAATPAPTGIDGCAIGGTATGTFPAWNVAVPIGHHAAGPGGTVVFDARGVLWRYEGGNLTTVAGGGGTRPDTATGPIPASDLRLDRASGIDVDAAGTVYATDGSTLFEVAGGVVTPLWTPAPVPDPAQGTQPLVLHDVHVSTAGVYVSASRVVVGSDRYQVYRVDGSGATVVAGGNQVPPAQVPPSGTAPTDLAFPDSRFDVDDAGRISAFDQANQRVATVGNDGLFHLSPAANTFSGLRTFAVTGAGAVTVAGEDGILRLQTGAWVSVPGPKQADIDIASDGSLVDLGFDGVLRRTSTTGIVTALAGADSTKATFTNAGRTTSGAFFGRVTAVQADGDDLLVAEEALSIRADGASTPTSRIVRVHPDGTIVAVAGNGIPADPETVVQPTGSASATPIGTVSDLDVDGQGNVVFASLAFGVGRVSPDGTLTQLMRSGVTGYWDETTSVEPLPDGSVIAGTRESKLWRITAPGQRALPTAPPGAPPTTNWSNTPRTFRGIETDRTGALVIQTDDGVLRVDLTRWTSAVVPGTVDADIAGLTSPETLSNGLAVDRVGNVYVAGTQDGSTAAPSRNRSDLWRIGPDDALSTMARSDDVAPALDVGDPHDVGQPGAVTVDASGRVVIADAVSGRIRRLGGCASPAAVGMHPLTPARLLDTRDGTGVGAARRPAPGELVELQVTGRGGVPTGATAASLNVTVTEPASGSYLTVWPCDTMPTVSDLNFDAGRTVPNQVTVALSSRGTVCLRSPAATHMVADVQAWYGTGGVGLRPLRPSRLLDTRTDGGPVPAATEVRLPVVGRGGVPASGATAVALNVTVTQPGASSWLTVYPCGAARPLASNLNFSTGQTIPNAVLAGIGDGGAVCLFSPAATHVVVDVVGSWEPSGALVRFLKPDRAVDTRIAWGRGAPTRLRAGTATQLTPVGALGVTPDARAVLVNTTAVGAASTGYVTFYPCDGPAPVASTLNVAPGSVSANAAIVSTSATGLLCALASTDVDVIVDVSAHTGS